ncbi:MAG: response regulator transcription factor [Myxococcota bacterium]
MKVLIAEDDPNILNGIVELLEGEGYSTIPTPDGQAAIEAFERDRPDFVCLDIMMPRLNGYDVCRKIRQRSKTVPIIFLSAKSEEIDKVVGLELGADDYVMKPFGVREFAARIRAVARRSLALAEPSAQPQSFRLGTIEVLPAELRARRGEELIELSPREVKLLETFHAHPGEVLNREILFRTCWGMEHFTNSRTLDQHISKLRKKIQAEAGPAIIETVHGAGYRWDPKA